MKKITLDTGWFCRAVHSQDEGAAVSLPHDAMISERRSENSLGIHNIGWFEAQDYVYTKTLQIPEEYKGKEIYFEIEGAYRKAEVFVNGEKIAYRPYGYSDFYVKASEALVFGGENEIRICTYNADQPNSRWYSGTGLYRLVHMYVTDKEHILVNGIRIRTTGICPPQIEVEVQATSAGTAQVQILDQEQVIAGEEVLLKDTQGFVETSDGLDGGRQLDKKEHKAVGKTTVLLPDARLWSESSPNLYTCKVTYKEDVRTETFGVRLLSWDADHGFLVNGKRVILRGACIHHDNGVLGACAFPEAEERKVRILKENGYNAIRSAHNPCSKALLDACDRLGMYVMDEYVDVWYIHKTEHDYAGYMLNWWETDLKEMVEKDYNHPSVIMYSTGNEVAETAQKKGIRLTGNMTKYLHKLDGTRPVSCGINIFFNFLSSMGLGVYSDKKAKKEAKNAAEKKKKPVGSEFYNTLAGLFGDSAMKLGATLYPCDVKTRDAYANMDVAGYNYGIFRYRQDLKKYPKRLILGSETFCKDAYAFWELAKKHPRIIGDFVWAGMDYIGEAGIGSWEYEDYAPTDGSPAGWLTAGSGRIDIIGNPNGEALYTKVALEQTKEVYLAVKPVYQTGKHSPSAWKMTEAVPSWSYSGCKGYKAEAEVYARAAEAELLLNGKSLGKKRLKRARAQFTIPYEDGELTAVAYDRNGREKARTSLKTAGPKTRLTILPETSAVKPGGLAFIQLVYTDEEGIWKPMEKHRIRIEAEGGIVKGFGSACPYNPDGYQQKEIQTYYGRALAVVQAEETGPVTVRVMDEEKTYEAVIPCR